MKKFYLVTVAIFCLSLSCSGPEPTGVGVDVEELDAQEDLSESLANDLLAMSLAFRKADGDRLDDFWATRVTGTPLDVPGASPRVVANQVSKIEWELDGSLAEFDRELYLEQLVALIADYESVEDVRFKVKRAEFMAEGSRAKADLKFFVVGRQSSGRREWIKGLVTVETSRVEGGPWQIERFELTQLKKLQTELEWFSEVSGPAGLNEAFPLFGKGANDGFVNHGAAAADLNQDGFVDIVATGVSGNFLYLNSGDGTFIDASESSLIKFTPPGSGLVLLDYDNDGDRDLFVARVGEQLLLENRLIPDGSLLFHDVSLAAGVSQEAIGFSVVSADVNNDSWPDIYVTSYNRYGTVMPNSWTGATNGTRNLLFVSTGDGSYVEDAESWGVADSRWSYAAQFIDLDVDGDQDLYVANDFGDNAFYQNEGGRFEDRSAAMGIVDSGFGMGVSFGDYDRDGDFDLHVTNMSSTAGKRILQLLYPEDHPMRLSLDKQAEGNSLYQNQGDGTFLNVSADVGGLGGGWAFGGGFVDLDGDGWEDIHTPNGFVSGETMKDT